MAPPQRSTSIRAFFMMERQISVQCVEVDFLLGHPTQRHDTRRKTVNGCGRVGSQAQRAFNVGVGHVHQHRLRHVVKIVSKGDDIGTEALRQVVDALASEHPAVRARHAWSIVVLLNHHG